MPKPTDSWQRPLSKYLERRETDPDFILRVRSNARENYRRIQQFLRDYKLEQGCADCGYNAHHAALEFDHVRGTKAHKVSKSKSIAQAIREIEKCEVVCATCHAIRTFERLERDTGP
jgi:hypothetical protein